MPDGLPNDVELTDAEIVLCAEEAAPLVMWSAVVGFQVIYLQNQWQLHSKKDL